MNVALFYLLFVTQPVEPQSSNAAQASIEIVQPKTAASDVKVDPPAEAPKLAPSKIVIPRDTPVHLMTLTEVTTKTDMVGHKFKLRVNEDVVLEGKTVIAKGTLAWGEVTSAESSGNLGKAGSLSARLLYIDRKGQRIPIEGDTSARGRTATAETVVGVLGLGIFGLFAKGNNAKIKAGEKITAFIAEDVKLDMEAN